MGVHTDRELNFCLCLLSYSCRNIFLLDLNLQRRLHVYTATGISCSNAQKHNSSDNFVAIYVLLYLKPGNFWLVELDSVNLCRMFLALKSRHGLQSSYQICFKKSWHICPLQENCYVELFIFNLILEHSYLMVRWQNTTCNIKFKGTSSYVRCI